MSVMVGGFMVVGSPTTIIDAMVEEGTRVSKDELLFTLEEEDAKLQLEESKANLEALEARLRDARAGARTAELEEAKAAEEKALQAKEQMEKEFRRVQVLHEEGFASQQELEEMQLRYQNAKEQLSAAEAYRETVQEGPRDAELDALRSQVEQARTGVRLAQRMVDRTRIHSPAEGEVALLDVKEGELVGTETVAAVLIDQDHFQAHSILPESHVPHVQTGDDVHVTVPAVSEEVYEGMVVHIASLPPEADARGYPVEIDLDPALEEKVRVGMYVQVELILEESPDTLVVPRHAMTVHNGQQGVFSVPETGDEMEIQFLPVKTGLVEQGMVEIAEGLSRDQWIVVEGQELLEPGKQVNVMEMEDAR